MKSGSTEISLAVALVALVGVIGAALIAAWTAERRQRRQLAHDADKQRRELQHDREMRDLQELRQVLDGAADALNTASLRLTRFHTYTMARRPGNAEDHQRAEKEHDEFYDALQRASDQQHRVALRIGRNNDVFHHYAKAVGWTAQAAQAIEPPSAMADRQRATAELARCVEYAEHGKREFTRHAQAVVGTAAVAVPQRSADAASEVPVHGGNAPAAPPGGPSPGS